EADRAGAVQADASTSARTGSNINERAFTFMGPLYVHLLLRRSKLLRDGSNCQGVPVQKTATLSGVRKAEVGRRRQRRAYAPRMPLDQRRQQLLDAALALIVREGYAGVTVDAIAQEAGVTKPVVYGAYANLSLLLTALLDRTQSDAVTQLLAAFPQ